MLMVSLVVLMHENRLVDERRRHPSKKESVLLDFAFTGVSLAAVAAWLMLALACVMRTGAARSLILFAAGRGVPIFLCVVYLVVLVRHWGSTPGGGFQSLTGVQLLFAAPGKMLGAWIHFLAFDLLIGRWMVDDALGPGRSRLPLLLALPATFMFGPLGLLLYLGGRALQRGQVARLTAQ